MRMTTPKRNITTKLLWSVLVGSMLATPLTLSASVQPQGLEGREKHDGRRGFRGDREGRGGNGRAILRELDLSEDQREQMRALRQGTSRDTFKRSRERRRALNEAVDNGADEATIRQLAFDFGEAEGDAAVERARMHAQMMEILTPEQRERYQALREEQKQKMEGRRKRMQERMENGRNRKPDSF
ncbi:MAG: hypothetical protein BMS9Abin37_0927 [Acidobacteriota bacterium]|nr:MAG: hypothetical protein BMS9Abin37_0927 [Acidobacteriota bacterium]